MSPCVGFLSTAPLASALSSRYSHRSVVIAGGLICSAGAILGSFGNNLIQLYLTVGFLNGNHTDTPTLLQTPDMPNTNVFSYRTWLCIDVDPHSDDVGHVLR